MKRVLTGSLWLLAAAASAIAATPPAEIRWNELAALIVGHRVSVSLPGGGTVEGEALSVRDDSLVLDIGRTTDSNRYPRGQTPIPRAAVTELRLSERRSSGGRILGTVVGAIGGMVAGGEIAAHGTRSEGAIVGSFTATAVAGTVAGYFVGRTVDRRTRLLHIAPAAGDGDR